MVASSMQRNNMYPEYSKKTELTKYIFWLNYPPPSSKKLGGGELPNDKGQVTYGKQELQITCHNGSCYTCKIKSDKTKKQKVSNQYIPHSCETKKKKSRHNKQRNTVACDKPSY